MGKSKKSVEYEGRVETKAALACLKGILEELGKGRFVLRSDGREVCFELAELVKLSVDAKRSGDSQSLKLKLKWKTGQTIEGDQTLTDIPLQIERGCTEPEA